MATSLAAITSKLHRMTSDPTTMTAGQINRELERLDTISSDRTARFIAEGRGYETPMETARKTDPLALVWAAVHDRRSQLRIESELRYGPGLVGRLPTRGFGPRKAWA